MSDADDEPKVKTGDVSVFDLVPCVGLCCCICSLYAEVPDCFGSVCENILCCVGCKILTCKPSKEDKVFCKCLSTDCDIIPFATCCQARAQSFCCDVRVSFPPTDEIPCLFTLCCLTFCYKYQCACTCGKDIRAIDEKLDAKTTPEDFDDDDWVEMNDPETGKKYYLSKSTGKTQWEKPK